MKNYEEIVRILRDEALEERETGWLSDLGGFTLDYDHQTKAIELGGWGSIDLGHLAGIVLDLIEDGAK